MRHVEGSRVERTTAPHREAAVQNRKALRLVRSSPPPKKSQTVDIFETLRRSAAEAERSPVDNRLLCGGERGEGGMEQMAL